MPNNISEKLLYQVNHFVAERMGLHFPKKRFSDLERGIYSAAREFDFDDTESCIHWLLSSSLKKNQIEILASHLTVGETYFFRSKEIFEALEKHILPDLIRLRRKGERRLRIWSAGCSTGEEPYSIAILLSRTLPVIKSWKVTILATDINRRFIQKASEGVYGKWSFREAPSWLKDGYFRKKEGGHFEISPHIKKMVKFSYLNLAEDTYPSLLNDTNAMDIIFCRNVLMYFTPGRTRKVVHRIYRSLVDGGWLLTSPSDASYTFFSQFATVNSHDVILYRKDARKPQAVEDFSPREVMADAMPVEMPVAPEPSVDFIPELEPEVVPSQSLPPVEIEGAKPQEPVSDQYTEALALYGQGSYVEASKKLTDLFSHNQDDSKIIALMIRIYANQGNLSEALEWCDKGIEKDKLNPTFHFLRATILQEEDLIDEALVSLKRTLYLDPGFVLAQFTLGNLTRQQRKLDDADRHFENALSLLSGLDQEAVLPESEGITAGRLREMIRSIAGK